MKMFIKCLLFQFEMLISITSENMEYLRFIFNFQNKIEFL